MKRLIQRAVVSRKVIGGKWKPLILIVIHRNPQRFNKLKLLVGDISSNMLASCLKELEQDGLIYKAQIKYHLTPLGKKICLAMIQLYSLIDQRP